MSEISYLNAREVVEKHTLALTPEIYSKAIEEGRKQLAAPLAPESHRASVIFAAICFTLIAGAIGGYIYRHDIHSVHKEVVSRAKYIFLGTALGAAAVSATGYLVFQRCYNLNRPKVLERAKEKIKSMTISEVLNHYSREQIYYYELFGAKEEGNNLYQHMDEYIIMQISYAAIRNAVEHLFTHAKNLNKRATYQIKNREGSGVLKAVMLGPDIYEERSTEKVVSIIFFWPLLLAGFILSTPYLLYRSKQFNQRFADQHQLAVENLQHGRTQLEAKMVEHKLLPHNFASTPLSSFMEVASAPQSSIG